MREIKFRAWDKDKKKMLKLEMLDTASMFAIGYFRERPIDFILMQFTGLKDKNGLTDLYEGDIIGVDGLKKGNVYENSDLVKEGVNILIQGFGTSSWEATNKKAMECGCQYSE